MKKNLIIITILVVCASNIFAQVPNYVPSNGLVGWWPFNGNANDESGNGNNGTVNGATLTTDRLGNLNSAFDFNSNSIDVGSNSSLNISSQGISVSVWILKTPGSSLWHVLGKRNQCGDFQYQISHNNSPYGLSWGGITPGENSLLYTNLFLNQNQWNNLIGTFDGTDWKLYLNAVLLGTLSSPITDVVNSNLIFGNSGTCQPFVGKIDDIGIWNRVLSACEIQDLYNAQLYSGLGISAGLDQTVCEGDPVTLTGTGGSNYQWNNGITDGQSLIATTSQEYIVIGEDANGCLGTDTVQIIVNTQTTSTQTQTSLDSYTWPVNGQTYTQSGTYTAVIPNSAGCDSTITLDLTLSFTGIDEQDNSTILISPNPSSDYFMVSASEELIGESYSIIDLNGKTLKEGTLTQKEQKIEIGNLSEGMYLFKINNETEQTFRIVKN